MRLPIIENTWDLYVHGLTQGAIGKYLACRQKFKLDVVQNLSVKSWGYSSAISFGLIFHDVLARTAEKVSKHDPSFHNTEVLIDTAFDIFTDKAKKEAAFIRSNSPSMMRDLDAMNMEYGLCRIMLEAYFRNWATDLGSLEWIALEKEFGNEKDSDKQVKWHSPTTGLDVPLRGKIDGIYRSSKDGRIWLFETKTKSRIDDSVVIDRLPYEIQVQLYLTAIEALYGESPAGVLYNLVRRPQLRQRTNETLVDFLARVKQDVSERPDFYFLRVESAFHVSERDTWKREFDMMMTDIESTVVNKVYYRNSGACGGAFGACQFIPICSRGQSYTFSPRERIYSELDFVIEE